MLRQLAERLGRDDELAGRVRDELEFSEILRQSLKSELAIDGASLDNLFESAHLKPRELMARVSDGKASVFECDQLAKYLWDNPEGVGELKRRLAIDDWVGQAVSEIRGEAAFVESLETRMWAETRRDSFVEDFADRLDQETEGSDQRDKVISFPWIRAVAKMGAVAALLTFGAFMMVELMISQKLGWQEAAAALVKSSVDVHWAGSNAPRADGQVESGQYELESGVITLKFPSGGELTVEGPAMFRVNNNGSAFVYHGIALARADEPEQAIKLEARGLSVLEQVPLIGIDARSEFSTNALALSGDGGICMNDGAPCRSIREFEAIKADHTRDKLVDIPYNPRAFSKTWEFLSGVETNAGNVRIQLPGTDPGHLIGEGEIQVFVENEAFQPVGELEADLLPAGQFAAASLNPGRAIEAEGELRSYLLQAAPSGESNVEASLTFEHKVVGVIYSAKRLEGSDQSVGSLIRDTGGDFSMVRGLDFGSDELLLSDDGQTLNLRLQPGENGLDQVRVLVALR